MTAVHDQAGLDDYFAAVDLDELPFEQLGPWFVRISDLLDGSPEVRAHAQRNEDGEFAFSPRSCPLCKAIADLEIQALTDVRAATQGAAACSSVRTT